MKPSILTLLVIFSVFLAPSSVFAAAEFNPNFLISDEELQDWQSMNVSDIQSFLEDKGGYLATLRIEDYVGKKRSVADIIYQAAKMYEINPKYALVKLQKEQSLITDKSPSQKKLDGATGYGITDGCGWTCDTYLRNKGFGKQLDSAVGIMRWYYDHKNSESWIKQEGKTYTVSGEAIRPESDATGFLYTYTPHIQGNENFWKLWQAWFDQTYTEGSLIKTANDSTVYLIQDGKRRPFKSMSALVTRFDPSRIITVPSSELLRYEESTAITLPNYAILRNGSDFYLLDYDVLRKFKSESVVKYLGFNPDEMIDISSSDLKGFTISPEVITAEIQSVTGKLVSFKEDPGSLYYLKQDTFHPLYDPAIAKANFPNLTPETVPLSVLKDYTEGTPIKFQDGTLFGVKGYNEVYVVDHGKKRHIASAEVFLGLGYKWNQVIWTNSVVGSLFDRGEPLYIRTSEQVNNASSDLTKDINIADSSTDDPQNTSNDVLDYLVRTPAAERKFIGTDLLPDVEAYVIADYDTGEILKGKNVDYQRPMASLTKVMTGYYLLKEGLNLNGTVTYDAARHQALYHHFRTVNGEKFRNSDLLFSLLVSSLNTPARMLASEVTASDSEFVAGMNTQAKEWGLDNTSFVDPAGVEIDNLSTPRDYLSLFSHAITNKTLRKYMNDPSYDYDELVDLDNMPHHFDTHTNALIKKTNLPFDILASKTGYLWESGTCLAMLIERPSDGKQFVIITMGNPEYTNKFDAPESLARYAVTNL